MKSIKAFILNCGIHIHDRMTSLIWTIGENRKKAKQKRIEKKIAKAISKFNFTIIPTNQADTLVVLNGMFYRVQFAVKGFLVRDDFTDEAITDRLTILKVLEKIK